MGSDETVTPISPFNVLCDATSGIECDPALVAQTLHALIAQCGYREDPMELAVVATAAGLGANMVAHYADTMLRGTPAVNLSGTTIRLAGQVSAVFREVAFSMFEECARVRADEK
jgi:hypothetical protein